MSIISWRKISVYCLFANLCPVFGLMLFLCRLCCLFLNFKYSEWLVSSSVDVGRKRTGKDFLCRDFTVSSFITEQGLDWWGRTQKCRSSDVFIARLRWKLWIKQIYETYDSLSRRWNCTVCFWDSFLIRLH